MLVAFVCAMALPAKSNAMTLVNIVFFFISFCFMLIYLTTFLPSMIYKPRFALEGATAFPSIV